MLFRSHWDDDTFCRIVADGLRRTPTNEFRVWSSTRPSVHTMADCDRAAHGLAAGLAARGIGEGDVVAFWMPNSFEAGITFYALALLATMPRGDAALPIRRQAGGIAEVVFARNPNHPGAAHYILHAYDHGTLAARALPAARAYAKIAPAASHALHMPAHTFLQLGVWDEAAATDESSWNASGTWAQRRGLSIASRDYHSLAWLQYEWTQQGRFSKTRDAIGAVNAAMAIQAPSARSQPQSPQHAEIGRAHV